MSPRLRKYLKLEQAGYRLDGRFNLHRHQGEPVQADLLFRRVLDSGGDGR